MYMLAMKFYIILTLAGFSQTLFSSCLDLFSDKAILTKDRQIAAFDLLVSVLFIVFGVAVYIAYLI